MYFNVDVLKGINIMKPAIASVSTEEEDSMSTYDVYVLVLTYHYTTPFQGKNIEIGKTYDKCLYKVCC